MCVVRTYLFLLEEVLQQERGCPFRAQGVLDGLGLSDPLPLPRAAALHVEDAGGVRTGEAVAVAETPGEVRKKGRM